MKKGKISLVGMFYLIVAIMLLSDFKVFTLMAFIFAVFKISKKRKIFYQFKSSMISRRKGLVGEERVNKILEKIKGDGVLLKDVSIEKDGVSSQIDHLLVTNKGLFSIETKNYSGLIIIDKNGKWIQQNNNGRKNISNVEKQATLHRDTLMKVLPKGYSVYDIIVIANNKTTVMGKENSQIPVLSLMNLRGYIDSKVKELNENKDKSYRTGEIITLLENNKENKLKVVLKKIKYVIRDNRVPLIFIPACILGILIITKYIPSDISNLENYSQKSGAVLSINEQIYLEDINAQLLVSNIIEKNYSSKIDVLLQNNSNKKIQIEDFNFYLLDQNGKLIQVENEYDKGVTPKEERSYTLNINKKINSSKIKGIKINYDDYDKVFEATYYFANSKVNS